MRRTPGEKIREGYFAIRIGSRTKNFPYFAVDDRLPDSSVPALFLTANEAMRYKTTYGCEHGVVVRVSVTELSQVYRQ